jgi:predicted RNase H-like HicB family nuclease
METITVESIPIIVGREEDGRWWADIEAMPGVMAYGETRDLAIAAVRALALRVAADCIEHGEKAQSLQPQGLADVPKTAATNLRVEGSDCRSKLT